MKNLPEILISIIEDNRLGKALFEFQAGEELIFDVDESAKSNNENDLVPKFFVDVSQRRKECKIIFDLNGTEYFENSDQHFLNKTFTKANAWLMDFIDSKHYVYIDDSLFIDLFIEIGEQEGKTNITLFSKPIHQRLEKENNFILNGDFYHPDESGFFNVKVERFSLKEKPVENVPLKEKVQSFRMRDVSFEGLFSSEFYNDRERYSVFYSQQIFDQLLANGFRKGTNSIGLTANITWYDDIIIIIDEIITISSIK